MSCETCAPCVGAAFYYRGLYVVLYYDSIYIERNIVISVYLMMDLHVNFILYQLIYNMII